MFNPDKTLRVSLLLEWIFIVAAVLAEVVLQNSLPTSLKNHVPFQDGNSISPLERALLYREAMLALLRIVATVALLFRLRWARIPYVMTTLLFALSNLADGPVVYTALGHFFGELSILTAGFISALIFFAPIHFVEPKEK